MALVDTRINYFTPPLDGSKPYQWTTANHPGGGPMRNWEPLSHDIQVENIRGNETAPDYKLDTTGFEFHRIPNKTGINFDDDAEIREKYYAESIENIKTITGASRVVIFDHNVPGLLSKRFQIINLWRPIANPAWQFPLALCDFRSVQQGDFVPSTLKYVERDGETLAVKYNPEHKWKYVAGMTPDEIVLIKCFDSEKGVATFTPHTAIDDPNTPSDAPDRQSIELRALVFYD